MRKYTIHRIPGTNLTFKNREHLAKEWNERVNRGPRTTLRSFAKEMGIPYETWRREYNRGKTGSTVRNPNKPERWIYSEYDAGRAQDEVNKNAANKGCPMRVTNILNAKFAMLIKKKKLSPYEKGSVENCNRLVRRWYPKGTDFGCCTRKEIRALKTVINGIHRRSLNGLTASQFAAQFTLSA